MVTRNLKLCYDARCSSKPEAVFKDVMAGAVYTAVDPAAFVPQIRICKTVIGGATGLKKFFRFSERIDFKLDQTLQLLARSLGPDRESCHTTFVPSANQMRS